MLGRLTVIIPSYGRQRYLSRQVAYWKNRGVALLILDGSTTAWEAGAALPENVRYFHMPVSIERRLGFAADRIKTDYGVLLSDDEFFLTSGLHECIRHLDANPDVISCKGMALGFGFEGRTVGYQLYRELRGYSVDGSTARERMLRHMRPYAMATLWAVMKRDVFCATLRAMGSGGPYKSAAAPELQTSLLAAYLGRCHVLPHLMWLRSYENRNIWWQSGRLSVAQWYQNPDHASEVESFFSCLEAQIPAPRPPDVRRWLVEAVEAYVAWSEALERRSDAARPSSSLLEAANRVARWGRGVVFPSHGSLLAAGRRLAGSGVIVSEKELSEVQQMVSLFHAPQG